MKIKCYPKYLLFWYHKRTWPPHKLIIITTIILYVKFNKNVKNDFIWSIILKYSSLWEDVYDMSCTITKWDMLFTNTKFGHMCILSVNSFLLPRKIYCWYLYFSIQYHSDPLHFLHGQVLSPNDGPFWFLISSYLYI